MEKAASPPVQLGFWGSEEGRHLQVSRQLKWLGSCHPIYLWPQCTEGRSHLCSKSTIWLNPQDKSGTIQMAGPAFSSLSPSRGEEYFYIICLGHLSYTWPKGTGSNKHKMKMLRFCIHGGGGCWMDGHFNPEVFHLQPTSLQYLYSAKSELNSGRALA
jgi:hypothetical protein